MFLMCNVLSKHSSKYIFNITQNKTELLSVTSDLQEGVFRPLYNAGAAWLEAVCSHFSVAVDGT